MSMDSLCPRRVSANPALEQGQREVSTGSYHCGQRQRFTTTRLDRNTQVKEQYKRSEYLETGPSTQRSQQENVTMFTSDSRITKRQSG